jgi:hypothetical protein
LILIQFAPGDESNIFIGEIHELGDSVCQMRDSVSTCAQLLRDNTYAHNNERMFMKNGIVKKVAALDKVVQICNAHGANYNPSNAALQPTALVALLQLAQEKREAVIVAQNNYTLAVNARSDSFEGIPKLAAKIANMIVASAASQKDKDDVKRIKARLATGGAKPAVSSQPQTTVPPLPTESRRISRRDRDSMLENLTQLVDLVKNVSAYTPNEPELKVEGLKAKIVELHALNLASLQAKLQLSNARIAMEKVMEGPGGVIDSTRSVKAYIRARFGMVSKESQQVNNSAISQ